MKKNLLGVFAIVLAVAFTAFTSPRFTDVTYKYVGIPLFVIGTDNSAPLADASKWDVVSSFTCPETGTMDKICKVKVSFTGTAPSEQQVIDALRAKYEGISNQNLLTDGQTFNETINGVSVSFLVDLRSTN